MKNKEISLATQIKFVIGRRILFCSLLLIMIALGLTFYDFTMSIANIRTRIIEKIKPIETFALRQFIINNERIINLKIANFNENNSFKVEWIPDEKNYKSLYSELQWLPPFSWVYNYKIGEIADYHLGYFKVTGSFLSDGELFSDLIIRLILLISFAIAVLFLLYPLASKIPKKLFLSPINGFLDLIENNNSKRINSQTLPIELQELENKILHLLSKAKEHERNKAATELGHLIARVAHDIRSPLAALTILVQETKYIPEQQRIMLRNISQRINDIANNLLSHYRNDLKDNKSSNKTNEPEIIFLLLDSLISEKRVEYFNKKININFNAHNNSYSLFANVYPPDFKRVLSNLINNAIESMISNGNLNINLYKDNDFIKISIQDNGCGMEEELIEQALTGKATSRKHGGQSIGLSVCNDVIKKWDGKLYINSILNIGTTAIISIPIKKPAEWFAQDIYLLENSNVIILDDDLPIHDLWRKRFSDKKNNHINLIFLNQTKELLNFDVSKYSSVCYFVDYEIIGSLLTGLDAIEQLELGAEVILVTSQYENKTIRDRCAKRNIKILPKSYVAYIPIKIVDTLPENIAKLESQQ